MKQFKSKMIKGVLMLVLLFVCTAINAQVLQFKTTSYAENRYNYATQKWSGWSRWEPSNMLLTIDLNSDIITVYSPKTQIYVIYKAEASYTDSDGDLHVPFKFIDQDGDRGTIKLLQRKSGSSEVYIEFSNIRWCYQVIRL